MKKAFMTNIKHFVDSNVRHRIDKVAHSNNEFFTHDLLLLERHFEDIRQICIDAEKRISSMLQSLQTSPSISTYTQSVQTGLNNWSHTITQPSASSNAPTASTQNPSNNLTVNNEEPLSIKSSTQSIQDRATEALENSNSDPNATGSQTELNNNPDPLINEIQQKHRKLPVVGILKFLLKSRHKLKNDSLLGATLGQCSILQTQLTKLLLSYEQTIGSKCLKPIQHILEVEVPNVVKLRKLYVKSRNDQESLRAKYNVASQKQQQLQGGHSTSTSYTIAQNNVHNSNTNKLEQLKKELDDTLIRSEQAKDAYEAELYAFMCREIDLINLLKLFYQFQAEYHQQVGCIIQSSLPGLTATSVCSFRKVVFGTQLDEHVRGTGRNISPVIELCVHLLHSHGLNEEGLFRIPGSTVKIKKLKNAINAWFVTLASRHDLESGHQNGRACSQPSLAPLYDLFKNTVSQSYLDLMEVVDNQSGQTLAYDDSTLTPEQSSTSTRTQLIFDVHSIAGLLKLYLRELPEPLLTYALHDQWISAATLNEATNEERLYSLKSVMDRLPKANYENLKHLIRFLRVLTCHRETNKMTSANLAIAMAPSLIRPKQAEVASDSTTHSPVETDDMQSLSFQMSSFGMNASLHAAVVEALINNAEILVPGQIDFSLPDCKGSGVEFPRRVRKKQDRPVKSTSPTELSTASSSSFSSNGSNCSSSCAKTHSRKGGSMEGLLDNSLLSSGKTSTNRPLSVHIQRDHQYRFSGRLKSAPRVPPNALSKPVKPLANNSVSLEGHAKSATKSPAPPVPPPTTLRHRQERLKASMTASIDQSNQAPRASSLRGTGTIAPSSNSSGSQMNASRPSVPPPDRPRMVDRAQEVAPLDQCNGSELKSIGIASTSGQNQREDHLARLANIDNDEDTTTAPISPVMSIDDSISDGDSSFDNDSSSPECLWPNDDERLSGSFRQLSKESNRPADDHVVETESTVSRLRNILEKRPSAIGTGCISSNLRRGTDCRARQASTCGRISPVDQAAHQQVEGDSEQQSKSPTLIQSTPL